MVNLAETANTTEEKAMMIETKAEEQVTLMDMEAKKAARRKARQEALATERKAFIQARKEARKAALEARKAERRVERKAAKIAANKQDDGKKVDSSTESETDVDVAAGASPDVLVKLQNRAAMKRQRQAKARAIVQARKKELIAAREAFIEGQKEAVRAERRANRQAKNKAARQAERKAARQAAREARKSNALIEIQEGIELVKEVDDRSAQMARREARMKKRIEERKAELQALKETRKRIRREAKREKQAVLAAAAVAAQKNTESSKPVNNEKLDDVAKELNDLKLAGENKIETEAVTTAVAKNGTESKDVAAQKARRAARVAELRMKKKQLANEAGAKQRARQLVAKAVNRTFAVGSDPVMIQDDVFVVKAVNDAGTILIEIAKKGNESKKVPAANNENANVNSVHEGVAEEKADAGVVADTKMDPEAKVVEANESAQKETMEEEAAVVVNDKKSGSDGSDWEVVDDTAKAKAAKREARKKARQNLRKQARREARKEKKLAAAEKANAAGPAGADEVTATSADEWETVVAA